MGGAVILAEDSRSLADLRARGARAATGFESLGIGPGDRIATLTRNCHESFEIAFAAASLGAYVVPINWHSAAPEVDYILKDSGASVLVAQAGLLAPLRAQLELAIPLLVIGANSEGDTDWAEWQAGFSAYDKPAPPPVGTMIYTSGTTGKPKGVRRMTPAPENTPASTRIVNLLFGLDRPGEIRTVVTGPMYHSAPNNWAMTMARADALVVLQDRFDPESLLRMIETHRITHLQMVPTMFWRLLKLPADTRARYDLTSLRFVVHAAAPCPPETKAAMLDWWGPVICEYYGASEVGPITFCTPEDAQSKPGTIGRLVEGAVLEVCDPAGNRLGACEIGEFCMRQRLWPDFEYHGKPQARTEIERAGLVTVGDVGFIDDDGYVFMLDRKKDMVISGGVNIYPAEIEAVLIGMPGVRDCAVFGIPDDEYGESLAAHVQLSDTSVTETDVRSYIAEHLARFKVPKQIVFATDLPREDSGKIFKRKLRAPYWEAAGRQI